MNLEALLATQLDALTQLLALLEDEQKLLLALEPDGDSLAELAHRKQALLEQAAELESRRRPEDASAAEAYAMMDAAGCADAWQSVEDMARRCAYANQLNGSLIAQRMSHNQRMLRGLRQLAGAQLYGADGQTGKQRGRIQSSA